MREDEETRTKKMHESQQEQETEGPKKKNKKRKKDKANTTIDEQPEPEPELEPERVKAKVQFIPEQPNKAPPLVGYFPSIYKPDFDHLDEEMRPKVRVYRNMNEQKNRTGRMELVVSPRDSSVDYVGTSYSGEAMAPQFCHYAVGVLDRNTQTLKIVPIAANKVKILDFHGAFCFVW